MALARRGFADPARIAAIAETLPTEYLDCRISGAHKYTMPRIARWIPEERVWWIVRRCGMCKQAERTWYLDKDCFILSAWTQYLTPPEGQPAYPFNGIGRPTQAGNAALRKELVLNRWPHTTPETEE